MRKDKRGPGSKEGRKIEIIVLGKTFQLSEGKILAFPIIDFSYFSSFSLLLTLNHFRLIYSLLKGGKIK